MSGVRTNEPRSDLDPPAQYEAPRLIRLGSIRDLTLGATGTPTDQNGGQRDPPGRR